LRRIGRVGVGTVAAFTLLAALVVSSTTAAQVTVGQTAPSASSLFFCDFVIPYEEAQVSVASGNSYVVPTSGVVTSWSTLTGPEPGQSLGFTVFRPVGGSSFQVVGHGGPHPLTSNAFNTFSVSIPVQAGDVIGTLIPAGTESDCLFETGLLGDVVRYAEQNTPAGSTVNMGETYPEYRVNVSATVLPPPAIASINPASGSIKGATVGITGSNFVSVTGVSFGAVPASGFTVNSEAQITAVAPPSKTLAKVPVTVTTVAGTATSLQPFAYEGCKVPKLKGKTLKAAKKKIRKGGCKVGKVKKLGEATAKTGKVSKQSPKPGKLLPPGTKVNVTLDE
jgi:hypothetical protein